MCGSYSTSAAVTIITAMGFEVHGELSEGLLLELAKDNYDAFTLLHEFINTLHRSSQLHAVSTVFLVDLQFHNLTRYVGHHVLLDIPP
jgi:hypothetical protein